MSTAKFEKLIDLIINEDQERAEQLFHEIVVEKSREIYESIIDEDMTTDLIDEISSEEEGMDDMMEDEFIDDEEIDGDFDVDVDGEDEDEDVDFDMETDLEVDDDHHADMGGNEELEDRVVDLEDKLDELMAEFESLMDEEDDDMEDDEEVDVDVDVDDEEMIDEGRRGRQEKEGMKDLRKAKDERRQAAKDFDKVDKVAEATELHKVPVTHNDGSDKSAEKSPVDANSGQKGMASHPVDFDMGGDTQQPKGPQKPHNYGTKGEGEVKGATSWKNKVGGDSATGKGKGESTPKPVNKQPAGGDQRSPVPESRRSTRKMIK